ncbi:hypothetical protein FRC03_006417 [Tulasnella sp. 419]|nr:hypothetical protein FRC03_006417 [Tulasnella sp. 419]
MSEPERTFTYGERLGMAFSVEAGFLSTLAVSVLLTAIVYKAIRRRLDPDSRIQPFFRSPMDYLFLILLFNDFIQSMGYVTILVWARDGKVTPGTTCTAQGILQHVGEVGTALSTLAIAIYTFKSLLLPWTVHRAHQPWLMPLVVFGLVSLFQLLMTLIPAVGIHDNPEKPFYGVAGYWCWITAYYSGERLGLEYVIFWFVALVNIFLYIPLFLGLRGNLIVRPHINPSWWRICSVTWQSIRHEDTWSHSSGTRFDKYSLQMLAYPIVYILIILPSSINRWASPRVANWPSAMSFFACTTLALSGLINVILYVTTRPSLLPLRGCCARTGLVDEEEQIIKTELTQDTSNHISQQPSEGHSTVTATGVEQSRKHAGRAPEKPMLDDDSSEEGVQPPPVLERVHGTNVIEPAGGHCRNVEPHS